MYTQKKISERSSVHDRKIKKKKSTLLSMFYKYIVRFLVMWGREMSSSLGSLDVCSFITCVYKRMCVCVCVQLGSTTSCPCMVIYCLDCVSSHTKASFHIHKWEKERRKRNVVVRVIPFAPSFALSPTPMCSEVANRYQK